MASALREAGYTIATCTPADAMRSARENKPDVLLLDGEMSKGQLMTAMRIFNRNPDTKALVVTLIGPARRVEREGLRLVDAFDIVARPLSRDKLLRAVERAAAWAAELRETFGLQRGNHAGQSQRVPGCDALLARPVGCPFHDEPALCERYVLRSGKIAAEVDSCDIPTYTRAVGGGDFIDFNRVNVVTCPKCLFSSASAHDFVDLREGVDPAAGLNHFAPASREAVMQGEPARRMLAGGQSDTFFGPARTADEGATAHRLAAHCAQALWRSNTERMSRFACQAADAYMTAALLEGRPDVIALIREEARDLLTEAVQYVEGPALPRATYQLIALGILLGDDRVAFSYMKTLETLCRKGDARTMAVADRFMNRAKRLWTDRDYHRQAA